MDQPDTSAYTEPAVVESFEEQEVFGDAPALGTHFSGGGSSVEINQV